MLASTFSIAGPPEFCTLILTILSGPKFALLEEHSRVAFFIRLSSTNKTMTYANCPNVSRSGIFCLTRYQKMISYFYE